MRSVERAMSPQESAIFHTLHTIVADVAGSVNAKFDARIDAAKQIASGIHQLTARLQKMMDSYATPEDQPGPCDARLLASMNRLKAATDTFDRHYRVWRVDHGVHLQDGDVAILETFQRWFSERISESRGRVASFRAEYAEVMKRDADEQRAIANLWSPTLSDRLAQPH